MNARTHYDVLGVTPDATTEDVRRAWRTLIQVWHPDRFTGKLRSEAEEMTKALNQAYAILSDEQSRGQYDSISRARKRPTPTRATAATASDRPLEIIDLPVAVDKIIDAIAMAGWTLFAVIVIILVLFCSLGFLLSLGANPLVAAMAMIAAFWLVVAAIWGSRRRRSRRTPN